MAVTKDVTLKNGNYSSRLWARYSFSENTTDRTWSFSSTMYLYIKPNWTFGPWGTIGKNSANLRADGLAKSTAGSSGTDFPLATYSKSGSYNENGDAPSFSVSWAFNVNSSWGGFANSPTGSFTATGSSIGPIRYWNDVNVYNPAGTQDYLSGYFDLYTSENNSWRYNLLNEDDDMTHAKGTYFQVQNIRPYYSYYQLSSVSGHDSTPASGAYRKTFDAASEVLAIYMSYVSYYLDLNGRLDGSDSGSISGYGTCDVTVGGTLRSGDCTDYYTAWPYGTSYSISDIRATTGHSYAGSVGAATSGTITGTTDVRLSFTTNSYTNTISHWTWGYKNGEGNNGAKNAYTLGSTSFSVKYGQTASYGTGRAKTIPNGFYLSDTFAGGSWNGGTWTSYPMSKTFTQIASNTSVEYGYYPYDYTISYTMNGGTNSSSNPSTYNVLYGVTFANPTRSGYDFMGWTINGTTVTGINPGANATWSSVDDLYNKLSSRTTGNKTVVANWRETKPSNVKITSYSVTGPFGINLSWSATGLNISNYTVYYRPVGTSTWLTKSAGTATSTSLAVNEETTYEFFVRATNPGGTGDSSTATATTPADQAKIRRKTESGWVKGKTYYKKDGQWVKAKKIYIKVDGVWKIGTNYDFGDLTNWDSNNSTVWNINYNANTGVNTIAAQGLGGVWEQKYKLIDTVIGASYTVSLDFYNPNGYTPLSGYNGIECQAVNAISTHNDDTKIGSVLLPPAANANKQALSFKFTATASTTYITINFGRAADNMTHSVSIGNIRVVRN